MSYSYRAVDDESDPVRGAVREMVGEAFGGALGSAYWDWKFSGEGRHVLVFAAETHGEVAGCRHSLVFSLRLEGGLSVPVLIGGDLVVAADHRGRDVARGLVAGALETGIARNPDVVAYAAFTWPGLADRLIRPLIGTVRVPSSARRWSKLLRWDHRIASLESSGVFDRLGDEVGVAGLAHTIRLDIEGSPPLWVEISKGRVAVSAAQPAVHQVRVSLRRDGIEALKSRSPFHVLGALVNGGIRVTGPLRYLRRMVGARSVYAELLRELLKRPNGSF